MFTIRPRKAWGARAASSIVTQPRASVSTLVVHHTAGKAAASLHDAINEMQSIQRQHIITNGWSDIGYNFVIDRRGRVWEGRGYDRVGAHTKDHNTGTVGVSFMGNYETIKPTTRQLVAFRLLQRRLRRQGFNITRVLGHRQMPDQSTACPGRYLTRALGL